MLKFESFWLVWELFFLRCYWDEGWVPEVDPLPLYIFEDRFDEADGIIIWLKPWWRIKKC